VASIAADDLVRMRANLLFDGPSRSAKLSRFWILLLLSAAIASAGIVSDSTATVIGAMIVAPLMVPILGTVLSISTGDRANVVRSTAMIVAGAAAAIAVGFAFGLVAPLDVVAATSSQVAGRVHPRLIDLLAAIATGAVGAFAQCRDDVSDTLPGVAIAISLVPPLAVVGLTLEGGAPGESLGALLLFLTNVAAILLTGVVVMALFRVQDIAPPAGAKPLNRRRAVRFVVALVVAIAIPLGVATVKLTRESTQASAVAGVANDWVEGTDWTIIDVRRSDEGLELFATGPEPAPPPSLLRQGLDEAGFEGLDVQLHLIPELLLEVEGG